ncbi:glycosyltransferase [Paenibacillus contaminans]|uniref:Glycosyltransferase family 2 protein n=1 Tax=Paenibacillus contaminans TaxID=450362 RepID=A0A329MMB8_9BACL|nr:glycosyltransferase family A protein [Paenibacillus contaminans]RAV20995.1 glycosyltransferase family 2 protein [Paenibacillus contaminans]
MKTAVYGYSIIACTKRSAFMLNLFGNFSRQKWRHKELIIILNKDSMNIKRYRQLAKKYRNVSVYQVPEKYSLGACLNFGVSKAKYGIIAKFDDDDYYAPNYLRDCTNAFKRSKAGIVGKRAHFMYLQGKRTLLLRNEHSQNRYVKTVAGATITFKKHLFQRFQFRDMSLGEDVQFCKDGRANGTRIYATSKFNFAAIRRERSQGHTWKVSYRSLMRRKRTKVVYKGGDYRSFVSR